jgi:hypothetical protein
MPFSFAPRPYALVCVSCVCVWGPGRVGGPRGGWAIIRQINPYEAILPTTDSSQSPFKIIRTTCVAGYPPAVKELVV